MKTYTIKKGKHKGFRWPKPWLFKKPSAIAIRFRLHPNCWHNLPFENANWYDLNKIGGISFGPHHRNSIRLGYRPHWSVEGQFHLTDYRYDRGKLDIDFNIFDTVHINEWKEITYQFQHIDGTAFVSRDGENVGALKTTFWGYQLFPYHGGDFPAHQDMSMDLQVKIYW